MSREIDRAFLKVYEGNNLGKASPEAVRIAKYYFTMGYEAAQASVQRMGQLCARCNGLFESHENNRRGHEFVQQNK